MLYLGNINFCFIMFWLFYDPAASFDFHLTLNLVWLKMLNVQ